MAISNAEQFGLLLWKNWLLQKRRIVVTTFQILLPALFALILLLLRMIVDSEFISTPKIWDSFDASTLPPKLTPPEFNCSSVNASTLDLIKFNCSSFNVSTLPTNMTEPSQAGDMRWMLVYSPNTSQAAKRMAQVVTRMLDITPVPIGLASEADVEDLFTQQKSLIALGAVVFDAQSFDVGGDRVRRDATVTYKIRLRAEQSSDTRLMGSDGNWLTSHMFPRRRNVGPRGDMHGGPEPGYFEEGFLAIQRAVDVSIMSELGGTSAAPRHNIDVQLKSFPYPPYHKDGFIAVLQLQLPLMIMLSFIVTAPVICKDVVLEKEKKLKESMKLMGMKGWLHWASWYFKFSVFMFISVAIMTFFFHVKIGGDRAIITYGDPTITFVFLLLYALSVMTFCFAISTFFSKASAGAAAGGIIYFVSYLPFTFISSPRRYPDVTAKAKFGISLVPNLAVSIGCMTLAQFESTGVGLQWSNINAFSSVDENFTILHTLIMLIIDIIFYTIVTWYFDALLPGDFGTPQPFYFPFTRWYWCGQSSNVVSVDDGVEDSPDYGDRAAYFEPTVSDRNIGIKIRNLTKKFNKKQRPAVDKLSIDMYEGDITALLGHNGAGKTTTMFMLTGFLPQSGGTAYINGLDLRREMVKIRKSLGLCPQHDVLFDTMTVQEHLMFFAKLKGCPCSKVRQEVSNMISVLHLEDKWDTAAKDLSGGMKRKLCVGIALIADSKFVVLDEPTSGMDPEARRQTWDILQSQRAGRTMILSTHFMDEADLLGDRIAIMADGQLQCCGSSMFLKNTYGVGYHLYIVKNSSCIAENILEAIRRHVPEVQLESNVGAELSFVLPKEQSAQFEQLFINLEQNQDSLGIDSFGVSVTTLEEVFLKVGAINDATLQDNLQNGVTANGANVVEPNQGDFANAESTKSLASNQTTPSGNEIFGVQFRRKTGAALLAAQRFYAMVIKHAIHSWRNRVVTLVQLLLPVIFAVLGCVVIEIVPTEGDSPPLPLNLSYFNEPAVPFTSVAPNSVATSLANSYSEVADTYGKPVDANGTNMDDYLLGIAKRSLDDYNQMHIVAATANGSGNGGVVGHFNNFALHSIAISLSLVDNALLRYAVPGSHIVTVNHPLPRSLNRRTNDAAEDASMTSFSFSINVSFGLAFLVGSFVVFIVNQRSNKAKHSQFISGVDAVGYWLAAFLWDLLSFAVPSVLIVIIVLAFQTKAYSEWPVFGFLFVALMLYGWSVIPFVYVQSFLFNVASSAYVWVTVFNIFSGMAAVLAIFVLKLPSFGTESIGDALEWVFYFTLPNFCFSKALQDLFSKHQYTSICSQVDRVICEIIRQNNKTNPCCPDACGATCVSYDVDYPAWESPGIGRSLIFMAAQGLVYLFIIYILESDICRRAVRPLREHHRDDDIQQRQQDVEMTAASGMTATPVEDNDVAEERQRIVSTSVDQLATTDAVVLRQLTKLYNNSFLAVDRLSVGIPRGECFGLLGVNGAGKTSTFAMLTGDTTISSGDAFLGGMSVVRGAAGARRRMVGFCPQFDALIDQMTVRETLWMYARLRGIYTADIGRVVDKLIDQLTLQKYADRQAGKLSGGNRRKLSTGIALIGNPSIIFLDEPTTGVDPVARRLLWNTLAQVRDSGKTLILTSHSMEECEALCTRMAVMVNGRFQCLGSTQHLKAKFGEGYSLVIKLRVQPAGEESDETSLETKTRALMEYVRSAFPNSQLKDQHDGLVHYRVGRAPGLTWAYLFGAVERVRSMYDIEDYSVSQTTLEQVFISFARMQREPQEIKAKSCIRACCCCCCDRGCCT